MKEYFEAKPLNVVRDGNGRKQYVITYAGQEYRIDLAPSQLDRVIPHKVYCTAEISDDGKIESIYQDRFYLLKELYGLEGTVRLKVMEILVSPEYAMAQISMKDKFGFQHVLMLHKEGILLDIGEVVSCHYQLYRDPEYDGVLYLSPAEGSAVNSYFGPEELFELCGYDSDLSHYYHNLRFADICTWEYLQKQVGERNNLWVFTFANKMKRQLVLLLETKNWRQANILAKSYLCLERVLYKNENYQNSFSEYKRKGFILKTESEIDYCERIFELLDLIEHDKIDIYLSGLSKEVNQGKDISVRELMQAKELLVLLPRLIDKHAEDFAWISYSAVHLSQWKMAARYIQGALDIYINRKMLMINGMLHLNGADVDNSELIEVIRLIGLQLMIQQKRHISANPHVKLAQMLRLASFITTDQWPGYACLHPKRLAYKSFVILKGKPDVQFEPEDFKNSPACLLVKIVKSHVKPYEGRDVMTGSGTLVHDKDGIRLFAAPLRSMAKKLDDCKMLYSVMNGKVSLCSQTFDYIHGLDSSDLERSGRAWRWAYYGFSRVRKSQQPDSPGELPAGEYIVNFQQLADDKQQIGKFIYLDKDTGNLHDCYLLTDNLFSVPRANLAHIFNKSDWVVVHVTGRRTRNTNQIELRSLIQRSLLSALSPDTYFLAQCVKIESGHPILYGDNGITCYCTNASVCKVGNYYTVRLRKCEKPNGTEALVDVLGESVERFDAFETNERVVKDYIAKCNQKLYEYSARAFTTELMFVMDRIADFSKTNQIRYINYQFCKLVACIERSRHSYLYDLLGMIIAKQSMNEKFQLEDIPECHLKHFPRLSKIT